MTFVANPRFKEEKFFGIWLIVDKETNYVNVNSLCSLRCLPNKESIEFNKRRTNNLIRNFISEIYYDHFKQFESWDNINEIQSEDSEVFNSLQKNKTSLYYYSKHNEYYNLNYDIFEGYYINRKILPWFISYFQPHLDINIIEKLLN